MVPFNVIDCSPLLDQAEDLRKVIFVSIIGTRPVIAPQEVIDALANKFNVDREALHIHNSFPKDFLLILPYVDAAELVVNKSRSIHTPSFTMKIKLWTRSAHAARRTLSFKL